MITARISVDGKVSDEQVDPADATAVLARDDAFLWLDSVDPTDDDLAVQQKTFGVHPLTIEEYPLALVVMFAAAAGVWWFFRRKDWL